MATYFNFEKDEFEKAGYVEIIFKYIKSNPEKIRTLEVHKCDDKYLEGYEIDGDIKRYKKFLVEFVRIEDSRNEINLSLQNLKI